MPIFFVGYALLVWWLAAKYRREAAAFAAIALGFGGLMGLNILHIKLGEWTDGDIYVPVLQSLMYPYTGCVTAVGGYIACLPQRSLHGCPWCGYDLVGLWTPSGVRCPECGKLAKAEPSYRRSGQDRPNLRASDTPLPATKTIHNASYQKQPRQAHDQAPAQP